MTTLSAIFTRVTSEPISVTSPAQSPPSICGLSKARRVPLTPMRVNMSTLLIEHAFTRTFISLGPITGSGISPYVRTSGPPCSLM